MKEWRWLSAVPNGVLATQMALQVPDEAEAPPVPTQIPPVIVGVVLVMELALVSGGAFLLLLIASVVGAVVRNVLLVCHAAFVGAVSIPQDVLVQISEAAAFGWGFLECMSRFFRRSKCEFVQRLGALGWESVIACILSMGLHSIAIALLKFCQPEDQGLVSWRNVHAAVIRSDGSLAIAEILQNVLLAPAKEELFFRGALVLVTLNRLHSVKWSVALSSLLFAAVHLANARHLGTQYSASYVSFQVVWALVVGLFLALRLVVSGSLTECLALHAINNLFALGVSKHSSVDLANPLVACSVLATATFYTAAIVGQLQLLQRRGKEDKRAKNA